MKGLVLAGGTATRLFPLTIVTNKHLLPIYDRPMIYYPIATLAGMGIREVMVIVGGKSVGDVVELLADGEHFGLRPDVPLSARRARHRPRHRPGPGLRRRRRLLLRPGRQRPAGAAARRDVAREFEDGPWGAGTLLYEVADPERFGVAELDAAGNVVGFEEKPAVPKSNLIPIGVYFLRPDAFAVVDQLVPVAPGRARDHGRAEPLPAGRPVRSPLRRSVDRRGNGHLADPGRGAGRAGIALRAPEPPARETDVVTEPAGHASRGCWSPGARASSARASFATSWPARDGSQITVLDKLTYAGNRANLAPAEADPEQAVATPVR